MKEQNIFKVENFLIENSINFVKDCSLKTVTWIKRGGITIFWVKPECIDELTSFAEFLFNNQIKFIVVGATSNLYFQNSFNPDIVISTLKLNSFDLNNDYIKVECGALTAKLSAECVLQGFEGFEGFVTIPGTVGAAVCNNSSCFNSSIEELVEYVEVITEDGIEKLKKDDLKYKRRSSVFKRKEISGVVLRVYLKKKLSLAPKSLIENSESFKLFRKLYQEKPIRNLGSCFAEFELKNTVRIIVWKLFKKLLRTLNIRRERQQWLNKNFLFFLHGKFGLNKYVSDYSLNCFVWKDENADEMFFKYKAFIESISKRAIMEIEIIDK